MIRGEKGIDKKIIDNRRWYLTRTNKNKEKSYFLFLRGTLKLLSVYLCSGFGILITKSGTEICIYQKFLLSLHAFLRKAQLNLIINLLKS